MHIPHILELSSEAKRNFLDSFDLVFFDCDGVIWTIIGTIPHTSEGVNLLKDAGKGCKFISNNSVRTENDYLEKFQLIGVRDIQFDDLMHPAKAMVHYIKTHLPKDAKIFSICDRNANKFMENAGINLETLEAERYLSPLEHFELVHLQGKSVDAVLSDINLNLNVTQLVRASLYLQKNENCLLIIGGTDKMMPIREDLITFANNFFVDILAQHTEQQPIVLGKPGKELNHILKDTYNIVDPSRVLFVGDNCKTDIEFAKECGFQTLLVLTGVTTKEDMLATSIESRPDYYAHGVFDFIKFFDELKK